MATLSKESLLARTLPRRDVAVDGGTVTVRALSRSEAVRVADLQKDVDAAEVFILACALVDPALTEDEVRVWRDSAASGEVDAVSTVVLELSGMTPEAAAAAAARFPA